MRYCPYQPYDEGIYIIKVFAADQARFFWELSWQVTIEATNETFTGANSVRSVVARPFRAVLNYM